MIHIASRNGLSRGFLPLMLVVALLLTSTSMSHAQSEGATPEHPPAANHPDSASKGAMECCKVGMKMAANSSNQSAAMECCELGMKGKRGTPNKDTTMECCRLGMKGTTGQGREASPPEKK